MALGLVALGVVAWRATAPVALGVAALVMVGGLLRAAVEWEEAGVATPRANEVRQSGGRWYGGPRGRATTSGRSDSTGARRSAGDRPADNRDYVRKDVGPAPLTHRGRRWALLLGLGLAFTAGLIMSDLLAIP